MTEKITFRIPGTVEYSYWEVTGTPEEIGRMDPEVCGALFASFLYSATTGERGAIKRLQEGQTALLPASEVKGEVQVQDVPQEAAEELLKAELGAEEINPNVAPYKQPPPAAAKKPWEQDKPKSQVTIDLSDF